MIDHHCPSLIVDHLSLILVIIITLPEPCSGFTSTRVPGSLVQLAGMEIPSWNFCACVSCWSSGLCAAQRGDLKIYLEHHWKGQHIKSQTPEQTLQMRPRRVSVGSCDQMHPPVVSMGDPWYAARFVFSLRAGVRIVDLRLLGNITICTLYHFLELTKF